MKKFLVLGISLASFNSFAGGVDFSRLSQALVSTSEEIALIKSECGSSLENVTASTPADGITEFKFSLVSRGVGRLGGTIFAKCEVKITENTLRTRVDGPVTYSTEHQKTQ